MTHPNPECNRSQAEFLDKCPPEERRFHELLFKVGNATFRYHQRAKEFSPSHEDWKEWIDGLEGPIQSAMIKLGFEGSKKALAFTRYVLEKNDIGLEEHLKSSIDPMELEEYYSLVKRIDRS